MIDWSLGKSVSYVLGIIRGSKKYIERGILLDEKWGIQMKQKM